MTAAAFKVRNPERDKRSDDSRIERLDNLLEDVIGEVRRERTGLRTRYLKTSENAAHLLDCVTDEMLTEEADEKLDALRQCVLRLKRLDAQESVLTRMQQDLVSLQGLE